MSRREFRESVFERDGHMCVICKEPARDAHHIMERRLFHDGGYFVDNGASLCEQHHIEAEQTTLSCDDIRRAAGIRTIVLPEHLYADNEYDKWGNIIMPNDTRIKGELFYDESVQKILAQGGIINKFQKYIKYPRTYHMPTSNMGKDDKMLQDDSMFIGKEVVVTLKMDGENTTMYNDYIHARSIDSSSHPSRNFVKGLWSQINYLIDENMRICGENLYARHSIQYDELPSYFMVFSIWIDGNCLSWEETLDYTTILGLQTVPVIYQGPYNPIAIKNAFEPLKNTNEGYVIRLQGEFSYGDFRRSVAKYVRPEFRQMINNAHGHWISNKITPNKINSAPARPI